MCKYICNSCLFFGDFSGLRAPEEVEVAPYEKALDDTLLRHVFSAVDFLVRTWYVIIFPIDSAYSYGGCTTVIRYSGSNSSLPKLRESE